MNNKKTVMIVEDSPTQGQRLEHILTNEGYGILYTKNGREALKLLETTTPDLVITDVVMPEMGGYELCRAIKSNQRTAKLPVILLTSLTDSTEVVKALECGADSFVTKPYESQSFLTQINQVLRSPLSPDRGTIQSPVEILFAGTKYSITSNRTQILTLLLSTFESAVDKNSKLIEAQSELRGLNKQLEEKVKERTAKVHQQATLLDITPDAIFVCDASDRIILWTKGAELIYGWNASEVIGKNCRDTVFKDNPQDFSKVASKLKSVQSFTQESTHTTKANKTITIEGRYSVVKTPGFETDSVLVVHTDVTEKKALEDRYLRVQRIQSLGSLSGGIAHDLNNVLTPILLIADVLATSKGIDEEGKKLLNDIQTNANRGARMIRQILTFARGGSSGRSTLDIKNDVIEVVRIATDSFPKSIETTFDNEKGLNPVLGDSTQLYQVILNLCINSRDAMSKGGKLTVRSKNFKADESFSKMHHSLAAGNYVLLEVSDTGDGIPPEVLGKIFDPFFTTKDPGKGTGLGLATVSEIVKSHGGIVEVTSEVGTGTTFKVYLPAVEGTLSLETEEHLKEAPTGNGEVVLVADNEASVRDIIRIALETYGYTVVPATDGAEATAIFAQKKGEIKVCLIDMNMPVLDGPSTIRTLQRIDPKIKIIAMSAVNLKNKIAEETGNTVKGYLEKPFMSDTLLQLVHDILQKE